MRPPSPRSTGGILIAGLLAAFLPVFLPALNDHAQIAAAPGAHAALAAALAGRAALCGFLAALAGMAAALLFWRLRAGLGGVVLAVLAIPAALTALTILPSTGPALAPLIVLSHSGLGMLLVWIAAGLRLRRLNPVLSRAVSAAGGGAGAQIRLVLLPALRAPLAAGFTMACGASCLISAVSLRFAGAEPVLLVTLALAGLTFAVPALLISAAAP